MTDYIVRDIALADFGRKELDIAETEMPGLMATRAEFGKDKPRKGARIAGSPHMPTQTGVLSDTPPPAGADARWATGTNRAGGTKRRGGAGRARRPTT